MAIDGKKMTVTVVFSVIDLTPGWFRYLWRTKAKMIDVVLGLERRGAVYPGGGGGGAGRAGAGWGGAVR